jgi:hypothetical protein
MPLVVVLVAIAAWFGGRLGETPFLIILAGGHLAAPIWAAAIAPRDRRVRAALLGPGLVILLHAIAIALAWISLLGAPAEGAWISQMVLMLWTGGLAAYALYCVVAFGATARR